MSYFKIAMSMGMAFAFNVHANSIDKTETLNGVNLTSGKTENIRTYSATLKKDFPYPLELVKNGITNFSEKCNNNYKGKRQFTSQDTDCKYFNEHLIETLIVKDLKTVEAYKNTEHYLLGRQVYNRGNFSYYELVQITSGMNEKNQKFVTISLRMLDDSEVQNFTEPKFSRDTAFIKSGSQYTITEVAPSLTHLDYEYKAETDHWIINKEVSVPQVFASISKTVNELMKSVEADSSLQKRALASHQ